MRTAVTALGLWALVYLGACSQMQSVVRSGPCAVEASIECQVERSSKVP
jgi:hypothetical protein